MWLKLVNSFSILWCQALFGLNVLHLSKVNFLLLRKYFVKLHGTHFNYVLACISDMFVYSNTGFARYYILPWTFAHCIFSLLFSCLLYFFVFICVYVLYCYHELVNKDLYICKSFAPRSRQITTSSLNLFTGRMLFLTPKCPSNSVKALKAGRVICEIIADRMRKFWRSGLLSLSRNCCGFVLKSQQTMFPGTREFGSARRKFLSVLLMNWGLQRPGQKPRPKRHQS